MFWEKTQNLSKQLKNNFIPETEGSSLTILESQLLLDEGITPEGKLFEHSQMEKDHFEALSFILKAAGEKHETTPEFIRAVSAKVMHRTGQVYNVAPETFDSSKGEYRKTGVFAVESLVKSLCEDIAKNIHQAERPIDIYNMAFEESRQAKSKDPIRAFLYQQQIKEFDRQILKAQSDKML